MYWVLPSQDIYFPFSHGRTSTLQGHTCGKVEIISSSLFHGFLVIYLCVIHLICEHGAISDLHILITITMPKCSVVTDDVMMSHMYICLPDED